MLEPPINELIEKAGNRYALVISVSQRARVLIDNAIENEKRDSKDRIEPLVKIDSIKPVTIATNEIFRDKIEIINKPAESEIEAHHE